MEYFAGLDVQRKRPRSDLIDGAGSIVLEATVATEPEAICRALRKHLPRLRRVGHEAGSLSPWLQPGLTKLVLPAVCLEARHTRAALAAQRNKTDRADARGIAHIMRTRFNDTAASMPRKAARCGLDCSPLKTGAPDCAFLHPNMAKTANRLASPLRLIPTSSSKAF